MGDRALVDAVLENYATAPISPEERALFKFIAQICEDSTSVRREDVDALVATGWSEEAVYDAITVCALFQFYNTWIDATGVSDLPALGYEMSGKRLAPGYADSNGQY